MDYKNKNKNVTFGCTGILHIKVNLYALSYFCFSGNTANHFTKNAIKHFKHKSFVTPECKTTNSVLQINIFKTALFPKKKKKPFDHGS